jgi:hypothetical protein
MAGRCGPPGARIARFTIMVGMTTFPDLLRTALLIILSGFAALPAAAAGLSDAMLTEARRLAAVDRLDAAMSVLDAEADGDPRATPALNELALAQARAGLLEDARETLERAIDTAPVYAQVYRNLLAVKQALALEGYRETLALPTPRDRALDLESISADLAVLPAVADVEPDDELEVTTDPGAPADFVRRWAEAWRRQDVDAYLDAYAPGYSDAPERDHAAWRELRRERVGGPAFIELEVAGLEIRRTAPDAALVEFVQRYRSDTFTDRTRKLLLLGAGEDGWRILREYSVR